MSRPNIIVATTKDWNIEEYHQYSQEIDAVWHLITSPNDLTLKNIQAIEPSYIFFPHWSWIVPKEITDNYHCVCFHLTDLPYGRGGSPLQNLIIRGHKTTKISALKMTGELDAGDIYLKQNLDLSGSAEMIFKRSASKIAKLIQFIIETNPALTPQDGDITCFQRRTPEQSQITNINDLAHLYDFIRMLDAPTYPKAYINHENYRLIFDEASIKDNKIHANVTIEINHE